VPHFVTLVIVQELSFKVHNSRSSHQLSICKINPPIEEGVVWPCYQTDIKWPWLFLSWCIW